MKKDLTPAETENLFFDALCNSLAYMESGYGLELTYTKQDYTAAKSNFKAQNGPDIAICIEDILMQILKDGNSLKILDHENETYTRSITIKDVHEKVALTPENHLIEAINETGDVITGDCILQSVFFGEVIFG